MSDVNEALAEAARLREQAQAQLLQRVEKENTILLRDEQAAEIQKIRRNEAIVEARDAGVSRKAIMNATGLSETWVDKIVARARKDRQKAKQGAAA